MLGGGAAAVLGDRLVYLGEPASREEYTRLAYPQLYPAEMLYGTQEQLVAGLRSLIAERLAPGTARSIAEPYTFDRLVPRYAEVFERVVKA